MRYFTVSWAVEATVRAKDKEDAIRQAQLDIDGQNYTVSEITDQEPLEVYEHTLEEYCEVLGIEKEDVEEWNEDELEGHLDGLEATSHGEGRFEE